MPAALPQFLVAAKRATYAAQGDAASVAPALVGAKQLEHRAGGFTYRDVYFGMAAFAGQETVADARGAIWSMVYAGAVRPGLGQAEIAATYGFLRRALRQVDAGRPYRGPLLLRHGDWRYDDASDGDLGCFRGRETIRRGEALVYRLDYCGGAVR